MKAVGLAALILCLLAPAADARPLRIACASSLKQPLEQLLAQAPGLAEVQVIPGATGKLSQQIAQGAPFDLFLAADAQRPAWLLEQGHARQCETYSQGRLVVWTREAALPRHWRQGRISIAEPRLAPYGLAARQALNKLQAWDEKRIIRGQNVAQAMQFAASGHVPVALISQDQAEHAGHGHYQLLDPDLYSPIQHQLCLLRDAPPGAHTLWEKLLHNSQHEPG